MAVGSDRQTAEEYRQRAEEMKQQAGRAETVYLQAIYSSIADNWERLAAQMAQADRAHKKDRATENWEKLAGDADGGDDGVDRHAPPPQTRSQDSLPRA